MSSVQQQLPPPTSPHLGGAAGFALGPGWRVLLQDAGFRPHDVLRRAQLPADLLGQTGVRIDVQSYFGLWRAIEAEADSDGEPPALRVARHISSDGFDPELFAALCSANMNSALERMAKFKRLLGPMALEIERTERHTRVEVLMLDASQRMPPVVEAFKITFLVQLARLATRGPIQPLRVGWGSAPRSDRQAQAYAEFFGVPVTRTRLPTLAFSAADAELPFLTANHGMWAYFEPALRQRLADLDRQASTADRVRGVLLESLPAGESSMLTTSVRLGLSRGTLQRRLQDEGTTFQQTLDAVRCSLALHHLRHSSMSGAEIAFLLGFEDPNSFVRAFQSWTGKSPQAVRRAHALDEGGDAVGGGRLQP